jgi:hypothetical protein
MAEERIIVRLDFQGLDDANQGIGYLEANIRQLREEQKKLEKSTNNLTNATDKQLEDYGKLDSTIKQLRGEKNKLNSDLKKLDSAERANAKTIEGLTKRNAQLTAEMRKLDLSTDAGQKRLGELRKEFLANDKQVRTFNESLGRHQHNVGNYQSAIQGAATKIGGMVAAIGAAIAAFRQINQAMSESLNLFQAQEQAERALEFATNGNSEALIRQAQALQQNSTLGDEAIIQQQAYLASLGFTQSEIQKVIQASADLAAANPNISFDAAVRNLSKTYSGLTGELGEAIPALREFSAEELKAGAATELLLVEYEGFAAELAQGTGALDQVSILVGDMKESFGELIFNALEPIIPYIKQFVNGLKTFIENASPAEKAILLIGTAIAVLIPAFGALYIAIASTGIGLIPIAIGAAVAAFATAYASSERFRDGMQQVGAIIWEVVKLSIAPLVEGLDLLITGLNKVGVISDQAATNIHGLTDAFKFNASNIKDATNALVNYEKAANNKAFIQTMFDWADATKMATEEQGKLKTQTESTTETIDDDTAKTKQNTEAKKEQTEAVLDTAEALGILNGNAFSSDSVDEDPIISAAQKRAEALEKLKEKTEKAAHALEFFGMTNEQIFNNLLNDEELENYEKAVASVAAAWNVANQALNINFENRKQQIEQQAIAEKEAIEATTQSEEQKRIAIERAEQKKALAIEKIEQKQAKAQKAQAIIQSIINTAIAITKALPNPFLVSFAAATGAAQTALIASQQFAEGGQVADLGSGEGGVVPTTAQNIPALANGDNVLATVRTGEVILNDKQQQRLAAIASPNIFRAIGVPGFADGGVVPNFSNTQRATASRIETSSQRVADTVQRIKVVNVATDTTAMALQVQNNANEATLG